MIRKKPNKPRRRLAVQAAAMRQKGYVTPIEASKIGGCARVTIYFWMNTGKIKHKRMGGARYVNLASLREYLAG
jgi:hypothetical protein